jgi:hypothetical protein
MRRGGSMRGGRVRDESDVGIIEAPDRLGEGHWRIAAAVIIELDSGTAEDIAVMPERPAGIETKRGDLFRRRRQAQRAEMRQLQQCQIVFFLRVLAFDPLEELLRIEVLAVIGVAEERRSERAAKRISHLSPPRMAQTGGVRPERRTIRSVRSRNQGCCAAVRRGPRQRAQLLRKLISFSASQGRRPCA